MRARKAAEELLVQGCESKCGCDGCEKAVVACIANIATLLKDSGVLDTQLLMAMDKCAARRYDELNAKCREEGKCGCVCDENANSIAACGANLVKLRTTGGVKDHHLLEEMNRCAVRAYSNRNE